MPKLALELRNPAAETCLFAAFLPEVSDAEESAPFALRTGV